jgi:hypothetical protein
MCTWQALYQNYIISSLQTNIILHDIPELHFSNFVNEMYDVEILMAVPLFQTTF